jgi:hypothetical protein
MTIVSPQFAALRLASSATQAARGRVAYAIAGGIDPAQSRREAMTSIGHAVSYEASLIGSVDMLTLLGLALVLALALGLGLKRDPFGEIARSGFTFLASPALRDRR